MSIASEIARLQNDSAAIAAAIRAKGITVPSGSGYDDYAALISQIGGSLPFTLLTYIQTDGTAYIDTGIKANVPISIEMKATMVNVSSTSAQYFIGTRAETVRQRIVPLFYNSGKKACAYYYANLCQTKVITSSLNNQTPIEVRFHAKAGEQSLSIKEAGDSSFTTGTINESTGVTTNCNIYVFCSYSEGLPTDRRAGEKLFYLRIYGDENYKNPVFLGYPCYYNGQYGLWDFVTNTFFGNAAESGSFTGK